MTAAIIFDMDGLLIDSEPVWDEARKRMAREYNVEWNSDDHKAVMGVSTAQWVSYMQQRLGLQMEAAEVEQRIVETMAAIYLQKIPFHPGAKEAVALAASRYPTGLASGSPQLLIDTVTGSSELAGKFRTILSGDQFPEGKPNPAIYIAAARALNVAPERCVCLEDSGNGILAGKRAGMKVIAVPDSRFMPAPEILEQADIVLPSLFELTPAVFDQLAR